jgi:hypothetical protein
MRVTPLVLFTGLAIGSLLHAQCGDPYARYSLMNATHDRISVDIDSFRNHDWRDMPLLPSQSAAFDSPLTRVKVRLTSGRVLTYDKHAITTIRTRAHFPKGDWLVDDLGASLCFLRGATADI